jgi:O-acetylserine/cysteine efflux transporter
VSPRHIGLAVLIALVWGVNFVVIRIGLESFPPLLLAALRFAVAALPALVLPRPAISWRAMLAIGLTLFTGQFALLFTGMAMGMPPGLASVTAQSQAFLTILIAAWALGEVPGGRQLAGVAVAIAGLVLIAATSGRADMTTIGLVLTLAAALSWAAGNVLLRKSGGAADMLALVSWLSLIPPLPLLALSLAIEGPERIGAALAQPSWAGIGALLYIAVLSTTLGYGAWGQLLKHYPAGLVAPFSLLVPIFGTLSAALLLGERFGPLRLAGMALILAGVALVVLPARWPLGKPAAPR